MIQRPYPPSEIEPKWQAYWEQAKAFRVLNPGDSGFDATRPKYYVLDMFPYPSGSGLHVGHPEGYTATDILSRYKRMKGFNVLHPMGWDAFGLPAEQHAVATNVHPRVTTEQAIANFKRQMKRLGFSYDWDREVATTDLKYYRWTQWIFLQMFNSWFDETAVGRDERGKEYRGKARPIAELVRELENEKWWVDESLKLVPPGSSRCSSWKRLSEIDKRRVLDRQRLAYMDEILVNWCPRLGTVLANEEVTNDGRSERGDYPVFRIPLKQWMLRITKYCERLLDDLEGVEWPDAIVAMQRNWIGKSVGAEVVFPLADQWRMENGEWRRNENGRWVAPEKFSILNSSFSICVYTTRPDTLFGATYMVLAPEHPLVVEITTEDCRREVTAYVTAAKNRTDLERTAETKEKTGVFTGACAINPANGKSIPIWVADYVLMGYGTGAIMAVPAHDERDYEFAQKFKLPIVQVVRPPGGETLEKGAYVGDGQAVNSGTFDGLSTSEFKRRITEWLEQKGLGREAIHYKLRDWLFSRQRYWGEPFPILHGPDGELVALNEAELPLDLPHMEDFQPETSNDPSTPPRPPLGKAKDWVRVKRDGKTYTRELNTMPQWAGSCWYYLRFIDPWNERRPWDSAAEKYWMNVDQYVGGAEHAVLHLLYARFWHKVLYDLGHVSTVEPFQRLFNQGLILSYAYRDRRGAMLPVDQVEERSDGKFYHKETGEPVEQIVAKMAKSLRNVVNPDEILDEFGADTFRLYEMYMGPLDSAKPWNTRDIPGLQRFLQRVWRLIVDEQTGELSLAVQDVEPDEKTQRLIHKLIKKVGEDVEQFKLNTAIAEMITFTNEMTAAKVRSRKILESFVLLLSPFAPHIAEELWEWLGHRPSVSQQQWPTYDPKLAKDVEIEVPIQINGKVRARMLISPEADETAMESLAREKLAEMLVGRTVRKVIVVRGKLVNVVVA